MSVHEGYRKGAAFVTLAEWDSEAQDGLWGTAFFVTLESTIYAVTAKHNLLDHRKDQPIYIVTNKLSGGYESIPTRLSDWTLHPETDVAVREVTPSDESDATSMPFKWLVPKEKMTPHYCLITIGDEVFTVGLYSGFHGAKSIQPIARFGHVALMPNENEKIKVAMCAAHETADVKDLPEIDAYLIEANGWHGQSGSPVFVSFGKTFETLGTFTGSGPPNFEDVDQRRNFVFRPQPACIGLIQGFYPDDREVIDEQGVRFRFNQCISIVVPSDKIIETLMDSALVTERERKAREKSKQQLGPVRA